MSGYVRPGPPTGVKQQIPGNHFRGELLEPERPGEHVWMAIAQYRVQAETLRAKGADGGAPLHLDRENLIGVVLCCYVCELPYTDRLGHRKCEGDPNELR